MKLEKIFESIKSDILTDDIKTELSTIFEASVKEKVNSEIEKFKTEFEIEKKEQLDNLQNESIDNIGRFLDFALEEYIKENNEVITSNIKAELFDGLVESIKDVLSKNYIKINEEKGLANIEEKLEELKKDNNKIVKENAELKDNIKKLEAESIFEKVSKDMTDIEKEKLKDLSSDFEISDIGIYENKLNIIKNKIIKEDDSDNKTKKDTDDNFKSNDDESDPFGGLF